MLPNPWLWKSGTPIFSCFMFFATMAWAGSMDQFTTACTFFDFSLASTPVRSVAVLSYTSEMRMVMLFSGASFSSCSLPALPKPVLLDTTPILGMPIFFMVSNILIAAWLSFWGTLNTYLASGFTMTSAAAQETRSTLASSQRFLIFIVSPLVEGPMIAKTFSSSISCLANEMAFSGSPFVSLITASSFAPFTPPAMLIWSTSICTVLASGAPRNEAGPVTENNAPILTTCWGAGFLAHDSEIAIPMLKSVTPKILNIFINLILLLLFRD